MTEEPNKTTLSDDCYFLLYFIMGTYFGPDFNGEGTRKSALQRIAEGLPPYTSEQLAGSEIKTSEIERIYYYLLRKADKSLIVNAPILHQFIQGRFPSQGQDGTKTYLQFPELFPPHLHPQTMSANQVKVIANVVYLRNPDKSYIKSEDIAKFKQLTGLKNLFVEKIVKSLPHVVSPVDESDDTDADDVPIVKYYRGSQKKRRLNKIRQAEKSLQQVQDCDGASNSYALALKPAGKKSKSEMARPGIVILTSQPCREELDSIVDIARNAYALTGSAAKGHVGSAIGLMDIGESDDSYLFRVALPGVKRENRAFQCQVESDGRVLIKGETVTGEKRIYRYGQAFAMQSQNMCPSGPFSISFQLPGPVDPQCFSGAFGTDAILEGVVMKRKTPRPVKPDASPWADVLLNTNSK